MQVREKDKAKRGENVERTGGPHSQRIAARELIQDVVDVATQNALILRLGVNMAKIPVCIHSENTTGEGWGLAICKAGNGKIPSFYV